MSFGEVLAETQEVEARYNAAAGTAKKSIYRCMSKISSWIMHYSQILDTLSQHHPEYLSLAWGAMKFVLLVSQTGSLWTPSSKFQLTKQPMRKGVLNHEKITDQLHQALEAISDVLPRVELHVKLYPTARMQTAMAQLYAHLLLFLRQAVKWFSQNSAKRAFSSLISPFELKYKGLVDGIRRCATTISEEASASSKAEIRVLHGVVERSDNKLDDMTQQMKSIYLEVQEIKQRVMNVQGTVQNVQGTVQSVQGTVQVTQTRIVDLQINEVIKSLTPKTLPEEILGRQEALMQRDLTPWVDDQKGTIELIQRLGNWISVPDSPPLLLLQAGPRAATRTRDIGLELLSALPPATFARVWRLSDPKADTEGSSPVSKTDILRNIIFQILRLHANSSPLSPVISQLEASRFQGHHSEEEWSSLLSILLTELSQFPACFLLVEAPDDYDKGMAEELLAVLEMLVNRCSQQGPSKCRLKTVLLVNGDLSSVIKDTQSTSVVTVQRYQPPPPHLRRPRGKQAPRALAWNAMRKRL